MYCLGVRSHAWELTKVSSAIEELMSLSLDKVKSCEIIEIIVVRINLTKRTFT